MMTEEQRREAGKKVRLIVCDLDGTFLDSSKRISPGNREAVERARAAGLRFSLCTGRIHTMMEYYVKELGITTPVVAANGALIWDPVRRESLWDDPMDVSEVMELMDFCKSHNLDYSALTMDVSYFSKNSVRKQRFLQYNEIAVRNNYHPMRLQEFDEGHRCLLDKKVLKVLIYELRPGETELAGKFLGTLRNTWATSSEERLLDISKKGVTKGRGVERLSELMGYSPEQVCVMGDYENDLSMFQYAGFSAAMGNACDSLKQEASFVTKSNDEDGVAFTIDKYLL